MLGKQPPGCSWMYTILKIKVTYMRYISLLLALVILGYAIKLYLDSSSISTTDEEMVTTHPQQTLERVEQSVDHINRVLQDQEQRLNDSKQ
jgi:uncharacterized membrane protein YraQ (UPF0718 family)